MNKIYEVVHMYDEDGGFGDAVQVSDVVARFSDKTKADEFVEEYADPHVYDKPYADLDCGYLKVREVELDKAIEPKDMWWRRKKEKYEYMGTVTTVKELVDLLHDNAVDEDAEVLAMGCLCHVIAKCKGDKVVSITFDDEDYAAEWNANEFGEE